MNKFLDDRRWLPKQEDVNVLITGQSLGGALAQLASLAYQELYPTLKASLGNSSITNICDSVLMFQFYCVTFGAFRIGGDSFLRLYDEHLVKPERSLRVTRYLDFVPMLPNKST